MLARKSVIASSVGLLVCAGTLAACGGGHHKPIDTTKLFNIESSLGSDFKTQTKGPSDVDPKILGPQKMPPGVNFDPSDCSEYAAASGRPPKGIRGKMSVLSAVGAGNQLVTIAVQADKDVPFDTAAAEKCKHVSFGAGKLTGYLDEVAAPQIKGAVTTGTHSEIEITGPDGQPHSRESYNFGAYLGDWFVLVTANPLAVKGQQPAPVDADRARQLLTDAVAALRS